MGRGNKRRSTTATTSPAKHSGRPQGEMGSSIPTRGLPDRPITVQPSWKRCTSCFLVCVTSAIAIACHYIYINSKRGSVDLGRVRFDPDDEVMFVAGHQKVSLFKPYAVDIKELLQERERNMQSYEYNYNLRGVDKRSALSLHEFYDVYDGKWPVVITDVVPQWTAFNWSRDFFFEKYRHERITMKAVDNSLNEAVSLALPLELFYKNTHKAFPNRWTYVEDELFIPTRPHLRKDIGRCDYLEEDFYQLFPEEVRPWNAMLLWGTKFSRSSLHIDPYNWTGTNAVIKGRKRWKLFPPGQDHLMSVVPGRKSGFPLNCYKYNSPVDAFDHDIVKHPFFLQAELIEFDQNPGELLVIPPGWFHQAFNMEETIAVSSQVMNRNNFRIVLEEIIKVGNVKRAKLPPDIDAMSPPEQVRVIMSILPKRILDRGREITKDALYQIRHGHEDKLYQLPLD